MLYVLDHIRPRLLGSCSFWLGGVLRCFSRRNHPGIGLHPTSQKGRTVLLNNRLTIAALILLSCVYLLVFIPPNLTGAKDPHMLAAFGGELPEYGTDEFAQFKVVMGMTQLGASPYETLKNILFYGYYYYGYTFFLTSMLAILPLRLGEQLFQGSISTTAYMVILRQLSPLFMVTAIILLVYLWTGFKSMVKSVLLFIFLGSIPAVFFNNMSWHPDSLVTLFVVLTIFSLAKDELRFGTWFYVAAVSCGLATGTKVIGLFFFLSVAAYLLLGLLHHKVSLRGFVKHSGMFLVVMILTIVISNPLLLIPSIARAYFFVLSDTAKLHAWGWDEERATGPLSWYTAGGAGGSPALQETFGFWWFYVLVLLICILSIAYNREKRSLNVIILMWILPISLYLLFFVGSKGSRYFIPVFLPLFSCIGNLLALHFSDESGRRKIPALVLAGMSMILCALQFAHYMPTDIDMYTSVLNRENRSSSIRFYRQLNDVYLQRLPQDTRLTIVREVNLYLPPSPNRDDHYVWGFVEYDDIRRIKPNLILLSRATINFNSDPLKIRTMPGEWGERALRGYDFFRDAKMGSLKGFHKLLETDLAVAFIRAGQDTLGEKLQKGAYVQ
jgi:hypothetical protein